MLRLPEASVFCQSIHSCLSWRKLILLWDETLPIVISIVLVIQWYQRWSDRELYYFHIVSSSVNLTGIFVHPTSGNATLGSTATLLCHAYGSFVTWTVNGSSLDNPSLNNWGIGSKTLSSEDSGTTNSTLIVSATVQNHEAVIQCSAGPPVVESMAAILRIQGM